MAFRLSLGRAHQEAAGRYVEQLHPDCARYSLRRCVTRGLPFSVGCIAIRQLLNKHPTTWPSIMRLFGEGPCDDIAFRLREDRKVWGLCEVSSHHFERVAFKRQAVTAKLT